MLPAISRTAVWKRILVIDRDTASRLGITPQAIDDTLYDAFGQRQVSTMFTQLNQYHVVLEAEPGFQDHPEDLKHIYVKSSSPPACWSGRNDSCGAVASSPLFFCSFRAAERAAGDQSPGTVSGGDVVVQPRTRRVSWARQRRRSRRLSVKSICRAASSPVSRERRPHFTIRCRASRG